MATVAKAHQHNILITGAAGYIGQHLIGLLPEAQVLDRKYGTELKDFDPKLDQWKNIEYVIHLADLRLQDINAGNLEKNLDMHREFLQKLLKLSRLKKVIFSSSCSVYGFSDDEIFDHSATSPTSFYAESKIGVEKILSELKIPHLVLRFGTAYGWSEEMRHDLFINQLSKAAALGDSVEIFSADAWRPYVHCQDFAHVLASSLEISEKGPLNIVADNLTKRHILDLPAFANSKLQIREVPDKDPRNYRVRAFHDRLPQRTSMNEGLQEMLRKFSHA